MAKCVIEIRAWTEDFYNRLIYVGDEEQCRQHDARVRETPDGYEIVPSDFPEAVRFTITVRQPRG